MQKANREKLEAAAQRLALEFDPVRTTDLDLITLILTALAEQVAPAQS